ncbi:MAG: tetratricopeptide repeat protein [Pirellulales bacterium]
MPAFAVRRLALATLFVAAAAPFVSAVDVTPEDAESLKSAQAAYDAGKHAEAVKLLLPIQAKYPDYADVPRMLTHAYFELGEFDKARQTALQAIAASRLSSDVLGRIAQIDQLLDDRVALLNDVRLLTVVDPNNRQWRLVYADLLTAAGSLDESAAVYRALIAEQSDSADIYLRLGNVLLKQERFAEAAATLETAWRLGAADPRLPTTIAGVWQSLGDDRQSLAWLERASAVASNDDPKLTLHIGQMLLKSGELDRAAAATTPLTKSQQPTIQGQAHILLGRIATARGQIDDAIAHWKQAAETGEAGPQLLAVLGAHYFNAGDYATAAKVLRRVVDGKVNELDAKNGDTRGETSGDSGGDEQLLRFLVDSLIRSGEGKSAREYLRQYVEQHGLSDEAKTLVRALATASTKPVDPATPPTDSPTP